MSEIPSVARNLLNLERFKVEKRISCLRDQINEYKENINSLTNSLYSIEQDYEELNKFLEAS